eukprot:TRINITY_DN2881_c0_g1_i4.p1 TRINITY_DN2881_c0_g1~~TRINITY_DN2881_c0_g1_i4.p1  ORF type:complete len:221 (-),score=39.41 TRINITY_DN2881_c0_g1_i4:233-895(-)
MRAGQPVGQETRRPDLTLFYSTMVAICIRHGWGTPGQGDPAACRRLLLRTLRSDLSSFYTKDAQQQHHQQQHQQYPSSADSTETLTFYYPSTFARAVILHALGNSLLEMKGVLRRPLVAFAAFVAAARLGHGASTTNAGVCLFYGYGIQKDMERAVACFRRATTKDDPRGIMNLAVCFYLGKGTRKNISLAKDLFARAVRLGYLVAYRHLTKLENNCFLQ